MSKTEHIDPLFLARVLVMPGADRLFTAFARIPPGPLRESVITHAEVIAQTYTGAPSEMQMADPLITAAQAAAPALPSPKPGRAPKTEGPEARVITMRRAGKHPQEIARELDMAQSVVARIIAEAKKAGIPIPNIRAAHGRPMEHKTFTTNFNDLSGQGVAIVGKAAAKRGISTEEYLRRKGRAVEMAKAGLGYPEIMADTHEDQKTISLWLSNARAAGVDIPYAARPAFNAHFEEVQPDPEPAPNVVQVSRWFGPWSALSDNRGRKSVEAAATRRNMTPDAYLDLQESIVRHRMAGMGGLEISRLTGEGEVFVKDVLTAAKQRGAVYPAIKANPLFEAAEKRAGHA